MDREEPRPAFSSPNRGNVGLAYPESGGNAHLRLADQQAGHYSYNLLLGQNGKRVPAPTATPSFPVPVGRILGRGSQKQVFGIDAERGIAHMTDEHPVGNGAEMAYPGEAMSRAEETLVITPPVTIGLTNSACKEYTSLFHTSAYCKEQANAR